MTNLRQIKYKPTKCLKEFCPVCGEQLGGEGSVAEPYHCSCGIWRYDWEKIGYEILREKK